MLSEGQKSRLIFAMMCMKVRHTHTHVKTGVTTRLVCRAFAVYSGNEFDRVKPAEVCVKLMDVP
jgi:hypothetical protein